MLLLYDDIMKTKLITKISDLKPDTFILCMDSKNQFVEYVISVNTSGFYKSKIIGRITDDDKIVRNNQHPIISRWLFNDYTIFELNKCDVIARLI